MVDGEGRKWIVTRTGSKGDGLAPGVTHHVEPHMVNLKVEPIGHDAPRFFVWVAADEWERTGESDRWALIEKARAHVDDE